jgi:hypothetical protein
MNTIARVFLVLLAATFSSTALSQLVSGRLAASFLSWEHFDSVGDSKQNVRAFQTVHLSVAQEEFSLHTSLLGTANIAGSFGDRGRVRVYSLFMRASRLGGILDVNLGRQGVYAGAGIGTIDGLLTRAVLFGDRLTLNGFAGAAVSPDFGGIRKNIHGNLHYGGQLLMRVTPDLRVGASYSRRDEERDPYIALRGYDTTFTPVPTLIETVTASEEIVSGDVLYLRGERLSVHGRYDHDLLQSRPSRVQASVRAHVSGPVSATVDFLYRTPRVAYNSIFSAFVAHPVREIEGGLEYRFAPLANLFARVARVMAFDEPSHRWTVGLNSGMGTISYAGSDGYAGQLQSFSVQGSYPLLERALVPSAGVALSSYRFEPRGDRQTAMSFLLGALYRPVPSFAVDLQGQLLTNPVYKNDLRLQARMTYWFAEKLSIF